MLIDKGSASASEILAGALKEAGNYDIIGETSFGKGTVQQAVPMGDGSNIKLTLYKWLTPEGNWIHKKGVAPTVKVAQPKHLTSPPIQLEKPLALDMNDEQIKVAQVLLKGLGYDTGREDGYYGKKMADAVKSFQKNTTLNSQEPLISQQKMRSMSKSPNSVQTGNTITSSTKHLKLCRNNRLFL